MFRAGILRRVFLYYSAIGRACKGTGSIFYQDNPIFIDEKIYSVDRNKKNEKGVYCRDELTHSEVREDGAAQVREDQLSHRHSQPRRDPEGQLRFVRAGGDLRDL